MPKPKDFDLKKPQNRDYKKLDRKTVRSGLLGMLVLVALVIGGVALFSGGSDESAESSASETASAGESEAAGEAVTLSEAELIARVKELGTPVYWVGPRAGTESFEFNPTLDGRIYIRYLTGDAKAGDPRAEFLTVGTYPVQDARNAIEEVAESGEGGQAISTQNGSTALSSSNSTNAYVVFNDQPDLQMEIFSPGQGEAAELATSGLLKQIE